MGYVEFLLPGVGICRYARQDEKGGVLCQGIGTPQVKSTRISQKDLVRVVKNGCHFEDVAAILKKI